MSRQAKLVEATVLDFFETAELERAELIFGLAEYKLKYRRKNERAGKDLLRQVDKGVAKTHNRRSRKDAIIPPQDAVEGEI